MKSPWGRLVVLAIASALSMHAAAQDMNDKANQEILDAMRRTSTVGHPDEHGEFQGMQKFARGDYAGAMQDFKYGARFGDKLSQLSIGLMYLNGQGVEKDPVTAFAWVAISAERQYPQFLATRDRIWSGLDDQQREKAKILVEQLYADYGDPVAKPRLAHAMHQALADITGTGMTYATGNDVISLTPDYYKRDCNAPTINGAPVDGCSDTLQDKTRWDPDQYMKTRDGMWRGTVTVGQVDGDGTSPDNGRKTK
ncbi:sel1 repeat family protein [Dyella sp.]|uniref:sel1 repeat family protein n=1 Tax=Dyella sp. TaxID=1869338 RepID=UPI002ED50A20